MPIRKAALMLIFLAAASSAQTSSADSQLTQVLITEIRQLRQDLQTTAAVVQRSQILMYRLQLESAALTRATQRLDDARNRCSAMQSQAKSMTQTVEQWEQRLRASQNPAEQKTLEEQIARFKAQQAQLANEDQQCQPRQIEAQSQLQQVQGRVDELQAQLDKIDKLLAGVVNK